MKRALISFSILAAFAANGSAWAQPAPQGEDKVYLALVEVYARAQLAKLLDTRCGLMAAPDRALIEESAKYYGGIVESHPLNRQGKGMLPLLDGRAEERAKELGCGQPAKNETAETLANMKKLKEARVREGRN